MAYERPRPKVKLNKEQRLALLDEYYQHYRKIAKENPALLNQKLESSAFRELLQQVGELLVSRSGELARRAGRIRDFLEQNAPPGRMRELLPDEFRAFCLALNALKVWVTAEQQAADRFLFGGNARDEFLEAAPSCLISGDVLGRGGTDLHHPVRDGRPPVPLTKRAHAHLEKQLPAASDDSVGGKLRALREQTGRSWINLRLGCKELLGERVRHSTTKVGASSRSFARSAMRVTGLSCQGILDWLDQNQLGDGGD
jgi:hypothetical protein